eukprot:350700-Chlamydomonas_euryale.AAC.2
MCGRNVWEGRGRGEDAGKGGREREGGTSAEEGAGWGKDTGAGGVSMCGVDVWMLYRPAAKGPAAVSIPLRTATLVRLALIRSTSRGQGWVVPEGGPGFTPPPLIPYQSHTISTSAPKRPSPKRPSCARARAGSSSRTTQP